MGEKRRLEFIWSRHPDTFRLDAGAGYVGGKVYTAKQSGIVNVKKGDLVVINPSRISYGIEGAGDRIGWTSKIVTEDMVGEKVAIFTSIEDKSATDRVGLGQLIWLLNVRIAGGIAKIYKECVDLSLDEIINLPRRKDKDKENKEAIINRLLRRLK